MVLTGYGDCALQLSERALLVQLPLGFVRCWDGCLHSGLDHVERVHDQNLRDTGHGARDELVDEGERLWFAGHGCSCARVGDLVVWRELFSVVA